LVRFTAGIQKFARTWQDSQLETEIAQNGWLTAEARSDLVFGHDDDSKWTAALRWIGAGEMVASIVPFKRQVYEEVVAAFREHLAP
jgi:hypothetical protein